MSSLSRELVFLILQFLDEEKFKETVHKLEQESSFYFNMKYFEEQVLAGNWEEVERYLAGFTKVDDNRYSMKIFFEVRKQKYLEFLDKGDRGKAADCLVKDLKIFASFNDELYKEITHLITLDNFRDNEQLSRYGDTRTARGLMLVEIKKLIDANPMFRDKLLFPSLKPSRLRTLINQSLNWQHQLCKAPRPNPDIKTLFTDHSCGPALPNVGNQVRGIPPANPQQTNQLMQQLSQQRHQPQQQPPQQNPYGVGINLGLTVGNHPSVTSYAPSGHSPAPTGWMNGNNPPISNVSHPPQSASHSHHSLPATNLTIVPSGMQQSPLQQMQSSMQQASLHQSGGTLQKPSRPAPLTPSFLDYQQAPEQTDQSLRRVRQAIHPALMRDTTPPPIKPEESSAVVSGGYTADDLPKLPARNLSQGSCVMSMDFHRFQQTILLVGTQSGDVAIWDVATREKLAEKPFSLWEPQRCSTILQQALMKEPSITVNRVIWEPNGQLFGVAFSKHIVHVYTYQGYANLGRHLEIDAHIGGVNDVAFASPQNQNLCVISCGDDKVIKVWDAATGRRLFTFEGHDVPVYSLCPHQKENIQFIFSTAIDGKIKAWLYDHGGHRVDYDAPGRWCTTMAYSGDGTRLFSCGTSKEGESSLVEWNESEGAIKRSYLGFRKRSIGVVQFDTTRNRFLAAGDEHLIKFWDMDDTNVLLTVDAGGTLPPSPRLRFNVEGSLLAVTSGEDGIKILANEAGLRLLRLVENSRQTEKPAVVHLPQASAPTQVQIHTAPSPSLPAQPAPAPAQQVVKLPVPAQPAAQPPPQQQPAPEPAAAISAAQTIAAEVSRLDFPFKGVTSAEPASSLADLAEASQIRSLQMPDSEPANKVPRLIYTNSGSALLGLGSNAVHKLWKWQRSDKNPSGKSTWSCSPHLWQPQNGSLMINDVAETSSEAAPHCIALSKNDSYVMSASGGKVSLFNMLTFKVMTTFMAPEPVATVLAFHPQDNNIIAVGMDDCTIKIYNVRLDETKTSLRSHTKAVTGLAFSNALGVLVSAGGDSNLSVWGSEEWERRKSRSVLSPQARGAAPASLDTRIQFHNDQRRLLVANETLVAVYDMAKWERNKQWLPRETGALSAPISAATFSSDSLLVYVGFQDGSVAVFDADTLKPHCRIASSAYIGSTPVHPLDIAAHPTDRNQFAVGLSNGAVVVVEPLEAEGEWGKGLPTEGKKVLESECVEETEGGSKSAETQADEMSEKE